jgi:hypothetical protein
MSSDCLPFVDGFGTLLRDQHETEMIVDLVFLSALEVVSIVGDPSFRRDLDTHQLSLLRS